MNKENYKKYVSMRAEKSPVFKNCLFAFLIGGAICSFSQLLCDLYVLLGIPNDAASILVSVTLIFIAGLLTGIGTFDKIAKVGGAGTLVPITGFANAVVSPAIDNKAEGFVLGLGSKMFIIAGPVLVYGTVASAIYGVFYYFWGGAFSL
ncbi:MAG: SpoVA/SpoVAEb family sporulation membrane protein [Clostridia bacterium]|nr:SpoVA/SpoVAEb family sporulation membrane protein [Clostridia bacterium]